MARSAQNGLQQKNRRDSPTTPQNSNQKQKYLNVVRRILVFQRGRSRHKEKFMETACNAWVDEKASESPPYTNDPTSEPVKTTLCGDRELCLLMALITKTKLHLMHACSKKPAKSVKPIARKHANLASKEVGAQGPGVCAEKSYICEKNRR